jgi:hypothetical protein
MVKIKEHLRNDKYKPVCEWPENFTVQWGGSGVVLGNSPYQTAFFEVFTSGGFIRGEGKDIESAEKSAFKTFTIQEKCKNSGGHIWSRAKRTSKKEERLRKGREIPKVQTYTNRGSFCTKCNSFSIKIFNSITRLGAWKDPLTYMELNNIMDGMLKIDFDFLKRLSDEEIESHMKYKRRLELRAKMFGIKLPDQTLEQYQNEKDDIFTETQYQKDCKDAVLNFYLKHKDAYSEDITINGIQPLFDSLTKKMLERELEDKISDLKI